MRIRTPGKPKEQSHRKVTDPFYNSREWARLRNKVWKRDQSICQLCKKEGKLHQLIRGTKDLTRQGTVDHITPREAGGSDEMDNLWLIGSNHHAGKSNRDKAHYR